MPPAVAFLPQSDPADAPPDDRYARQRLLPWWDQDRLARARVVVVGAGAVGNEALKLLALVGVGQITVIDFDTVSPSNLSRTVLFRAEDVGLPKATLAARRTRDLNPDVHVTGIDGDVGRDLGLATLAGADVVLGALDSVNARWALNRRCLLAGVPWINAGITASDVQVTRHVPGAGACYECTFTPGMVRRFNERYSCTGLVRRVPDRTVPTTAIGASVVAGLMVHDALRLLHDPATGLRPGQRQTLLLDGYRQFLDDLPVDPDCPAHAEPVRGWWATDDDPATTTVAAFARRWGGGDTSTLSLGVELVLSFACPACGTTTAVGRPTAATFEDAILCPTCRQERVVERGTDVPAGGPLADRTLADLGVPPHDLIRVGNGARTGIWLETGGSSPWRPPPPTDPRPASATADATLAGAPA